MAHGKKHSGDYCGDAMVDGYTRLKRRAYTSSPGEFLLEEDAQRYDDLSDVMWEFSGDRESALLRRMRTSDEGPYSF